MPSPPPAAVCCLRLPCTHAHGPPRSRTAAEDVNRLMGRGLVEHIAQMLLLARPTVEAGAPPPRPWFPAALLVASAYSLCNKSSLEENRRALWEQVGHCAVPSVERGRRNAELVWLVGGTAVRACV